jgi:very-short-patch-repair endonuclease
MSTHRRPPDTLPDLFIGSQAVAAGLLTTRQLHGPFVARVTHGVYRPVWVPLTHKLKCRAACLVLPPAAVVTGVSAASTLGLRLASSNDDVMVALPLGVTAPHRSGIRLRQVRQQLVAGEVLDGVRLAHRMRMAFDAVVGRPLPEATAALDALARHGLVDLGEFSAWLATCHDNNVCDVRRAAACCDPRAESQPESIARVVLADAGFDVVPQYRVAVGSRVVARVDLALPELKIAIEYDGRWHEEDLQRALDNDRLAALRAAGWTVIVVTAELLRDRRRLVSTVAAAVAERRALHP